MSVTYMPVATVLAVSACIIGFFPSTAKAETTAQLLANRKIYRGIDHNHFPKVGLQRDNSWYFPSNYAPNWVSYGPYQPNGIDGNTEALFKLSFTASTIPSISHSSDYVLKLDVNDAKTNKVVGYRYLRVSEVMSSIDAMKVLNTSSMDFGVPFSAAKDDPLEYRVYAYSPYFNITHVQTLVQGMATLGRVVSKQGDPTVNETTYYPHYFYHECAAGATSVSVPMLFQDSFFQTGIESTLQTLTSCPPGAPLSRPPLPPGFLTYGPYRNDFNPNAVLTAYFTLAIDDATWQTPNNDNSLVAYIDVNDATAQAQNKNAPPIQALNIARNQFKVGLGKQVFPIKFVNPRQDHQLEFRVYTYRKAYLYHDSTTVVNVQ